MLSEDRFIEEYFYFITIGARRPIYSADNTMVTHIQPASI